MRRVPPPAADHVRSVHQRMPLHVPLHRVPSVEVDQVKASVQEVEACRLEFFHGQNLVPFVCHDCASRYYVEVREHAVDQHDLKAGPVVLKRYVERLRVILVRLRVNSRKAAKSVLPLLYLKSRVPEVDTERAALVPYAEARAPEVARSLHRKLLRQIVKRIRPVATRVIRVPGKSPVREEQDVIHLPRRPPAIIQMDEIAILVHPHLIRRVISVDREDPLRRIMRDCHAILLYCLQTAVYRYAFKQMLVAISQNVMGLSTTKQYIPH